MFLGQNNFLFICSICVWTRLLEATNLCGFLSSNSVETDQFLDLRNVKLLLIGGSDGSGTRGVVSLLERLGVPVVVDDPVSKDVHGAEIGGWPSLITPLLSDASRKVNILNCSNVSFPPMISELSSDVLLKATLSIAQLIRAELAKQPLFPPKSLLSPMTTKWRPDLSFKAPISMAIVPLLIRLGLDVKFIHVVRDGRDIAFSKNQSPVQKFFNATFSNHCYHHHHPHTIYNKTSSSTLSNKDIEALRGAMLWSSWNAGMFHWARNCPLFPLNEERKQPNNNHMKLKYFLLRIEDLFNDEEVQHNNSEIFLSSSHLTRSSRRRENVILSLANFVGANLSTQELCCLVQEEIVHGGSSVELHVNDDQKANKQLNQERGDNLRNEWKGRYGKWRSKVEGNVELENSLNALTASTLNLLGYSAHDKHHDEQYQMSSNVDEQTLMKVNVVDGSATSWNFPPTCEALSSDTSSSPLACSKSLMKEIFQSEKNSKSVQWKTKHFSHQCEYISQFSLIQPNIKSFTSPPSQFIQMVSLGYGLGQHGLEQCCDLCYQNAHKHCKHFSFESISGECWLMGGPLDFKRNSGFMSGWTSELSAV